MKKNKNNHGVSEILYYNDTVNIIYEACTACYNNTKDISYQEKKEYIKRRVNAGHDSVLEHGYVSFIIHDIPNTPEFAEAMSQIIGPAHYLYIQSAEMEDGTFSLLIGGSVRAYKHFIIEMGNYNNLKNNFIAYHILKTLSITTVKEFYGSTYGIIMCSELGIYFVDEVDNYYDTVDGENPCTYNNSLISILDGFIPIKNYRDIFCKVYRYGFVEDDVKNVLPVTILFKNMSRTATHQLVRHRNAITQESQRYVDYSNAKFTIPDMSSYMEDYEDKKFNIEINGNKYDVTLEELSEIMISIYPQLLKQGMKKEDARAFLPSNVQCGRLYMTFTYKSLEKFIELRTDPHAQTEIRTYAESIRDIYHNIYY